MANTIQIKRSSTTGSAPDAGDLAQGELAVNLADEALFTKDASDAVVKLNAPSIDDKNTGATKHVTIDTSGNVGIGTSSPARKLHVLNESTSNPNTLLIQSSDTTTNRAIMRFADPSTTEVSTQPHIGSSGDNFVVYTSSTERARIDSSGNLLFNSGYGSAAVAYGCRAWVNFNGTGTVAIRASGNVSSITDEGTGDYTVNFTTAMPDDLYTMVASANSGASNVAIVNQLGTTSFAEISGNRTASAIRLIVRADTGSATDTAGVFVTIFR